MNHGLLAQRILWIALLVTLGVAVASYRWYVTTPELRFPETEAWWRLLPLVPIGLVIVALLIMVFATQSSQSKPTRDQQPY